MACGVLHVLKSKPTTDLTTTHLLVNLTLAGAAVTEEASSMLAKNGRIAGRKRVGGCWDSDKRDGGHRTPAVQEIRGRRSQQRPGHIIHKPTLSRPNPPTGIGPAGPAVTTNAPLPGGRSKIIWGFVGIFSEIGKFNFPLIPGDRRRSRRGTDRSADCAARPRSTPSITINCRRPFSAARETQTGDDKEKVIH